jgi:hypothetical protein
MSIVAITDLNGTTWTFKARSVELVRVNRGGVDRWELWGQCEDDKNGGCCIALEELAEVKVGMDGGGWRKFTIDARIWEPSARERGVRRKRRRK